MKHGIPQKILAPCVAAALVLAAPGPASWAAISVEAVRRPAVGLEGGPGGVRVDENLAGANLLTGSGLELSDAADRQASVDADVALPDAAAREASSVGGEARELQINVDSDVPLVTATGTAAPNGVSKSVVHADSSDAGHEPDADTAGPVGKAAGRVEQTVHRAPLAAVVEGTGEKDEQLTHLYTDANTTLPQGAEPVAVDGRAGENGQPPNGGAAALKPTASGFRSRISWLGHYVSSSLNVMSVEFMASATLPIYIAKEPGFGMQWLAHLATAGMLGNVIGRQASPLFADQNPMKKAYLGTLKMAFLAALAIGLLANFNVMTAPLLVFMFFLYRSVQGSNLNIEDTIAPSVAMKDETLLASVRGEKAVWNSLASVLLQQTSGALIVILGSAKQNLIIAPWLYLVSILVAWLTLSIPKESDEARLKPHREKMARADAPRGFFGRVWGRAKEFGASVKGGYGFILSQPILWVAMIASMLFTAFLFLTFLLLAPEFSLHAIGEHADPAQAGPIKALIITMFMVGTMYSGKIVKRLTNSLKARFPDDQEAREAAQHKVVVRWIGYGALSLLLIGLTAVPLPAVAPVLGEGLVSETLGIPASAVTAGVLSGSAILGARWPLVSLALMVAAVGLLFPMHIAVVALAFLAFGALRGVADLFKTSLFDSTVQRINPGKANDARASVMASSVLLGAVLAQVMNLIFHTGLSSGAAFLVFFLAVVVPAALAGLWVARRLATLTRRH